MDNNEKKEKLEKHIEVLKKSYDNIVEVMEEDVEKKTDDKGKESVALKDDKIKTYAEGIRKSAETLNYLYSEISEKEKELEKLNEEDGDNKEKEEVKVQTPSNLNKHLK